MALKGPTTTQENDHEMFFRWYCEELIEFGYLKRIVREAEMLSVFPKQVHKIEKHYKSKKPNSTEEITLLQETNYTYDFLLVWTEKAVNIFTEQYDPDTYFVFGKPVFISHKVMLDTGIELVSYIDVKPHIAAVTFGGGKMSSYYTFPLIQKYLMLSKGLFINKAIPIHSGKHGRSTCLFAVTFTPNRYRYTDKSGALRNIPYRKKSITSYASQREAIIKELLGFKADKESQQTLL